MLVKFVKISNVLNLSSVVWEIDIVTELLEKRNLGFDI